MAKPRILCSISTRDRYDVLAHAIQSVINQSVKPDHLTIFDDGAHTDLREHPIYKHILPMLQVEGITWNVAFGSGMGQHRNHQIANRMGYDYVWRLDDDEIAKSDVLEKLLSHMKPNVGAVGGSVITLADNEKEVTHLTNKLSDIYHTPNIQWSKGTGIVEVEHLYSSFLYRAGIVNYPEELSPVAHREETIFTYSLKQAGYKLLVDRSAITYHLRQDTGGIRSHTNAWFYEHDERLFQNKLESWGYKLITLETGLGDHLAFLNVLPSLIKKYKHVMVGCCHSHLFKDYDVTVMSVAASKVGKNENIYKWMIDNNWTRSIVEAYEVYYGVQAQPINVSPLRRKENMTIVISPYSQKLRNSKINAKNYPYWQKLISLLRLYGHKVIQIGITGEEKLVDDFRINLPIVELKRLLTTSDAWISVDNFLPHLAHLVGKPGIVLFGRSDPNIFGYKENINLLVDRTYLRPDQFNIWEPIEFDTSVFVEPEVVVDLLKCEQTK